MGANLIRGFIQESVDRIDQSKIESINRSNRTHHPINDESYPPHTRSVPHTTNTPTPNQHTGEHRAHDRTRKQPLVDHQAEMWSLVLIRDHRRQLPWSSRDAASDASPSSGSCCIPTALAIDPVHGTGFLLLAREGRLLACDPEAGCVWTADLDAAVAEGAEGEEELAPGPDDGTVRTLATIGRIDLEI